MSASAGNASHKGNVLLIGGTGYVGDVMRYRIRDAGYTVRLLTRSSDGHDRHQSEGFEPVLGDATNADSIVRALDGVDAVVNLVAIIKEQGGVTFEQMNYQASVNVANAARQAGVRRMIQMSALGAGNLPDYPYHYNKWRAENHIKDLGLDWTIFRPSIIFGPGDKAQFITQLADVVKKAPLIPVVGDGKTPFQPLHLNDVSDAFVRALDDSTTIGETYELGGPDRVTYEEILDEVARTLDKRKPKIHLPPALIQLAVTIMNPLPLIEPPVTTEQLKMLKLDNSTDSNAAPDLVGHELTPLRGNIGYVG